MWNVLAGFDTETGPVVSGLLPHLTLHLGVGHTGMQPCIRPGEIWLSLSVSPVGRGETSFTPGE